jgi:uncharacterized protein
MAGNARWKRWPCIVAADLASLLALLFIAVGPASAAAPLTIQDPGTYVVDNAQVLQAGTKQSLENLLGELNRVTTAQVKLLTVPSLEGEDIFTFSQRHYQLWKLGTKAKKNGALIVFALADRKIRIHTGYGLEGALPDSWIGSLSRDVEEQYFRAGKYSAGLYNLTVAVVNKVADDTGVEITGAPNERPVAPQNNLFSAENIPTIIFLLLFFGFILYRAYRGGSSGSGSNSGWFGGPGGFGGFGGGFGGGSFGGGGGSFGGGGGFSGGGGSFGGGGSSGGGGGGASW